MTEDKQSRGVTVMVTRRPKPGRIEEFEEYLKGVVGDASSHPGHLGVNIFKPEKTGGEYRILFKFDSEENLSRWEASESRQRWHKVAEAVSEPPQIQILTGLETWFALPARPDQPQPPKHKMALVIWIGITVLVLAVNFLLGPFLQQWPLIPRTLIMTAVIVVLMTYLVMPFLTRLFKGWLFKPDSPSS